MFDELFEMVKEIALTKNKKRPTVCYNILPSTGELIRINWGESGYVKVIDKDTKKPIIGDDAQMRMLAMNTELGISEEEAEAMMAGSMFGWKNKQVTRIFGEE